MVFPAAPAVSCGKMLALLLVVKGAFFGGMTEQRANL